MLRCVVSGAIGNADDTALADEARRLLDDESPLVRGAAVWALSQLMAPDEFAALASDAISTETDASVRAEWQLSQSDVASSP